MTPARTIACLTAASLATLALGAATAQGQGEVQGSRDVPTLGHVFTTPDNVTSIVARSASAGWPHRLNRTELRGLGQMFSRAVFPLDRTRYGRCRYANARVITCGVDASHTFVYLRVTRLWEDGTGRARVVAVVR